MARKRSKRAIVVVKKKANNPKSEVSAVGQLLRSLGGLGGRAAGSLVGLGSEGASAGSGLGAMVSRWLGAGDYTVSTNSLVSSLKATGSIPMMHNNGQSVIVRHKEFVSDILSSTTFAVQKTYPLNPGLDGSFPWLAAIAGCYQEYTWRGVIYHYVPTSGSATGSTDPALGSVMMATSYRATSAAYTSKQTMLNEYFASDSRPSDNFAHPIECDPKENPYNVQYVRSGAVPSGEDQKTYDLGVVYVATQGMPLANKVVGELWVTYEVELRKPRLTSGLLPTALWYVETRSTGITSGTALGTTAGTPTGDAFVTTSTTITFPANVFGDFVVLLSYPMGSMTAVGAITVTGTNCTVVANIGGAASTLTAASNFFNTFLTVTVPDPSLTAVLTFSAFNFAGIATTVTVRVYEVNALAV